MMTNNAQSVSKSRNALKIGYLRYLISVSILLLGLSGCMTNQQYGQLLGGAAGGALGSQFGQGNGKTAMTIAGALGGAAVGGSVGRSMDDTARLNVQMNHRTAYQENRLQAPVTYSTTINGIPYNPNGMKHDMNDYYQRQIYYSKGFVDEDEAGIFFDDRPDDKYVVHQQQVCVKDPFYMTLNGQPNIRVTKVKCRQPNGRFAWVP